MEPSAVQNVAGVIMRVANEEVSFHREAARVSRDESKKWYDRGHTFRANAFKKQASWHEIEANRLSDNDVLNSTLQNTALLFAKECIVQGMSVGYLRDAATGKRTLYIRHTFMGLLSWDLDAVATPSWLPVYGEIISMHHPEDTILRIEKYLRPLDAENA